MALPIAAWELSVGGYMIARGVRTPEADQRPLGTDAGSERQPASRFSSAAS